MSLAMPYQTSGEWYEVLERGANAFDEIHQCLTILGDADPHFGAESQGGKLKPYRLHLPTGGTAEFQGWILNPFPSACEATARLIGPAGWESPSIEIELSARERKEIQISITPPVGVCCRRQPVALEITVDGRPFGQVAEALITVGNPRF